MAKARIGADGKPKSLMGEFRQIFLANPKLLKSRSNNQVVELYLETHPGRSQLTQQEKSTLANVKSVLRHKKRKRGRKMKAEAAAAAGAPRAALKKKSVTLETLEIHIDDCMTLAKNLDREGLDSVIRLLRDARNEVVWKSGS